MTNLRDILDYDRLQQLIAGNYVRALPSGDLTLYNYTDKATFEGVWTPETVHCRGLIATPNGTIVARPLSKFANLDEPYFPENTAAALLERPGPIDVTEKLDGSMVAVWFDPLAQAWRTTTRGSWTSSQARAARDWLEAASDLSQWESGLTYVGEWCAPDNRVVLPYAAPTWTLLAARFSDGREADYHQLRAIAERLQLPMVRSFAFDTLAAVLQACAEHDAGMEGWVIRWPDGHRVKLKTQWYIALHRLVSGLSPARIRDALLDGTYTVYLHQLPEELRVEAEGYAAQILGQVAAREAELLAAFARLAPLLAESRKAFALAVQNEPPLDRPALFMLADKKPLRDVLLRALTLRTREEV